MANTLFCGDNLQILRDYIRDESVNLIYLDPPFKRNRNFNLLFEEKDGVRSTSQKRAFDDTWEWSHEAGQQLEELIGVGDNLSLVLSAFKSYLNNSDMLAYIVMMAPRLIELKRVLKPNGSLYLHCDPTASHYLKILLDAIFKGPSFRNEIIWRRSDAHNDAKQGAKHFGRVHDVILFYTKSQDPTFNTIYNPLPQKTIEKWYRNIEPASGRRYNKADVTGPGGAAKGNPYYEWHGIKRYWRYSKEKMEQLESEGRLVYSKSGMAYEKRYLDKSRGVPLQDWWDDISMLRGIRRSRERVGYPTQKPRALLQRIIEVSTNPGDVVLDPFCGCGTAIEAAQQLQRRWIGIDIAHIAVDIIHDRMKREFGDSIVSNYRVIYEPQDIESARALAKSDPFAFQAWIVQKLGGMVPERPRMADRGVDGYLFFQDDASRVPSRITVSVKSGKRLSPAFVRDLQGTMARERVPMGILVTIEQPTKAMIKEAASAGVYRCLSGIFPKVQIITIEKVFSGVPLELPVVEPAPKKRAAAAASQDQLGLPGIA